MSAGHPGSTGLEAVRGPANSAAHMLLALHPRDPHRRHARNGKACGLAEASLSTSEYPAAPIFNPSFVLGLLPKIQAPLTSSYEGQASYSSRPHLNRPIRCDVKARAGPSGARSGEALPHSGASRVAAGARGISDGPVGSFRCPGLSKMRGMMRRVSCDAYLWRCLIRAYALIRLMPGVWGMSDATTAGGRYHHSWERCSGLWWQAALSQSIAKRV